MGRSSSRNTLPAQPQQEHRDAPGGLAAPMAFTSRFSRSGSRTPSQRTHDDTISHPILSVFELERLLYTGKTACNHADEVWPGLYLGDQYVHGLAVKSGPYTMEGGWGNGPKEGKEQKDLGLEVQIRHRDRRGSLWGRSDCTVAFLGLCITKRVIESQDPL